MASSVLILLVGFFIWAHGVGGFGEALMEESEILGLYEVMGCLLDDPSWGSMHPQPCTETPWPGLQCEISPVPLLFHVTKIHIGPDIVYPPCKLNATLSMSLQSLPFLKTLSLFNCFTSSQVSLSPSLFGTFSYLEHLALESNPSLVGQIPSSLSNVTTLRVLSLSQNNLQGEIPKMLGGLVNLEQLDLSFNNLSGEIPQEIGRLKSLTILDLGWNGLEGQLPSSLGQLSLLQKIDLSYNKLTGEIPEELGSLKRLVLLDLSHNLLKGPIPNSFSSLEQLEYLLMDNNPLRTVVPLFLGTLNRLTTLSFSNCGLIGPIPVAISSMQNLTALSLDNNNLNGSVPPNLESLPLLDHLNLSHNQLGGELLFSQEFIERLGNRLDVRANLGLCTKHQLDNIVNISMTSETAHCLDASRARNNQTCEENPDDLQKIEPPHKSSNSSSSNDASNLNREMVVLAFEFFVFTLILM
ncbi:Leucine-rich repeat [Dillenia turbinata]|uniref:Leucine-rich repeat n=1 Tax=Dillenia turbinata TaxID=194707 RepID=A0AAN8Z1D7_9MAGN